jgi:hypothetical protein
MKQFLYDWAPPAFDHPCLWRCKAEPFLVGKNIGWLGTDFKKARAASVSIDRTMVELSVMEGSFTDDELRTICRSLVPVDKNARKQIIATPLAELCYQHRHSERTHSLPCGLFAHRRESTSRLSLARGDAAPESLPGRTIRPSAEFGYRVDSVFWFSEQTERTREAEFVYELGDPAGSYVRVLVSPKSSNAIAFPPRIDEQPCSHHIVEIADQPVHTAFVTEPFGPHEAVWQQDDLTVMLLTKPRADSDIKWFHRLVADMAASNKGKRAHCADVLRL